ncbi:ubiquitin-conjugating enzyme [Podospora fimiseda]|uniref:E2 ubiquitin-conjugating enzyme n=1 Tax=Podospora fimiseda TaxID=252190 RepID=A0AAN7BS72_9PEZI|nr:ubiquitin-conjugating enzyme [Podospora fimiseda]
MGTPGNKRLVRELADCHQNPPVGLTISVPDESNLYKWHVIVHGPPNTVYAGGNFGIVVNLPRDYPFRAPVVTFATRIYHPNVTNDNLGNICLSILKAENWKPAIKLVSVLEAVRNLLIEPQPDDPLEARIADEYKNDRKEFEKNARSYVAQYAKGPVKWENAEPTPATAASK